MVLTRNQSNVAAEGRRGQRTNLNKQAAQTVKHANPVHIIAQNASVSHATCVFLISLRQNQNRGDYVNLAEEIVIENHNHA